VFHFLHPTVPCHPAMGDHQLTVDQQRWRIVEIGEQRVRVLEAM
jgi:hypothetical protein